MMMCFRFGSAPTLEQVTEFCQVCSHFLTRNQDQIIGEHYLDLLLMLVLASAANYLSPPLPPGVHCTHGYNRTGFLIIAYLVEQDDWR